MGVIRPLDPQVIGQIAAGEVVERPAFAIKEMVENSIDAGATAITIEIRDGGLTWFRVSDNGKGIAPEDIRMAFARHATSKLRTAEELAGIHTLGFRGEALASIAAVAHVEMKTRAAGQMVGVRAQISGGVFETIEETASPEGTSITVRDLFYNVPARKKFLKKPATEGALVSDLVLRLILARPDISFRLMSAERTLYRSVGNGNLRDALFAVLGAQALSSLTEVDGSAAGAAIRGFVGIGDAARATRSMQTFVLNGRYIRSGALSQALDEACKERVMVGKYPICALHLTMPFEAVDVNVHPNKLEVRFQDERLLMAGLSQVVRQAFVIEPMQAAPKLEIKASPTAPKQESMESRSDKEWETRSAFLNRPTVRLKDIAVAPPLAPDRPAVFEQSAPAMPSPAILKPSPKKEPVQGEQEQTQIELPSEISGVEPPLRVLGVAWKEYIIVEKAETLYLIDQHAAHERILYERMNAALNKEALSQKLLAPQIIQLTHKEYTVLLDNLEALNQAGFEIEDFGSRSVQVRAVPVVLGVAQLPSFFGALSDCIAQFRDLPSVDKCRDTLVKLACRKAVKAGDRLGDQEIDALIEQMLTTGAPPTCPHGRPLVVALEKREVDKRFRRIL